MMAAPQTRLLLLIFIMLQCADSTDAFNKNIHTISRTASQGETVVFHCNVSGYKGAEGLDVGWRKEEILLLFNYSPVINQTVTNYTSSRMYVDPNNPRKLQISDVQPSDAGNYTCFPSVAQEQWILTIEVSESEPELCREMFLYIIPAVAGAVAVCFVFCTVWIHRKWKKKQVADTSGTRDDHAKALQTFHLHTDTLTSCVYTKTSENEDAIHSYGVAT
ncbi:uncharacterized protein LOC118808142 [Colossoma macropomum]|uniref:uncharacterized protein LOC118808142 n=1 Tax=Colossoma macropomum TaxID=42526 RepID=UPI0018646EF9|nr:uncharacterized protein LOC118808142 [Colossoma macropomum]